VRQRRVLLGMTQTDVADTLGLSFQQVQKYENGTNRIGASRLFKLSQVFDVTVEYFFEDMPPEITASSQATKGRGKAKTLPSYEPDPMVTGETLELVRSYYGIDDASIRKRLREMTKILGAGAGKDS
jgi:transcriptional regulator with XRE-family HTH domain